MPEEIFQVWSVRPPTETDILWLDRSIVARREGPAGFATAGLAAADLPDFDGTAGVAAAGAGVAGSLCDGDGSSDTSGESLEFNAACFIMAAFAAARTDGVSGLNIAPCAPAIGTKRATLRKFNLLKSASDQKRIEQTHPFTQTKTTTGFLVYQMHPEFRLTQADPF